MHIGAISFKAQNEIRFFAHGHDKYQLLAGFICDGGGIK